MSIYVLTVDRSGGTQDAVLAAWSDPPTYEDMLRKLCTVLSKNIMWQLSKDLKAENNFGEYYYITEYIFGTPFIRR